MADKIYSWAFVGAGGMAHAMARDLAAEPRARIHSVYSRTARSAKAFAAANGECKTCASLEELIADPGVDVVYINSPNNWHYSQTKLALEAGKAVLCEKPFTLNADELSELIEIARQRKTFLMEAMWVRYLPMVVKLRELLSAKSLGEIRLVRAWFHLQLPVVPEGRIYNLAMGGGSLLDVGIYPISFASMVMGGPPAAIGSQAKIGSTGVDENFGAVFHYEDGRMATVSAGVDGSYAEDVVIHGSQGSLRTPPWKFSRFTLEKKTGEVETVELPAAGGGYVYQAQEVIRCLDAGLLESPVMPLDESLAIMQTLDSLRAQWGLSFPGE